MQWISEAVKQRDIDIKAMERSMAARGVAMSGGRFIEESNIIFDSIERVADKAIMYRQELGAKVPVLLTAAELRKLQDDVFEAGVRFVLFTRPARARPQLLQLPRQTGTEIAHRKVQTDLHSLPPALALELIRREQFCYVPARNHVWFQPFASRHSRSLARARCISTQN
jgi:hypothetical protein